MAQGISPTTKYDISRSAWFDDLFDMSSAGMTEWIHRWKKNGWKSASGQPVKNKSDIVELDELLQREIKVHWVRFRDVFCVQSVLVESSPLNPRNQ